MNDREKTLVPNPAFDYLRRRRKSAPSGHPLGEVWTRRNQRHVYICGRPGFGKSRMIELLVMADIRAGHGVCVIDPGGDLYPRLQEFVAGAIEHAERKGHDREQLLERFLFLDASSPSNSIRLNPLSPHPDETVEQQVDDVLRALQRLFGSLSEQRRIKNTLQGALLLAAELNRLPPQQRPRIPERYEGEYPLGLFFVADYLNMSITEREQLLAALAPHPRHRYRRKYHEFFEGRLSKQGQVEIERTSWGVLQDVLDDETVLNVLDGGNIGLSASTVHIPEVLRRGQCRLSSMFCG